MDFLWKGEAERTAGWKIKASAIIKESLIKGGKRCSLVEQKGVFQQKWDTVSRGQPFLATQLLLEMMALTTPLQQNTMRGNARVWECTCMPACVFCVSGAREGWGVRISFYLVVTNQKACECRPLKWLSPAESLSTRTADRKKQLSFHSRFWRMRR